MTASKTPIQNDVLLEAAQWFAVLRSGNAEDDDHHRWQTWLGEQDSPQRRAWAQVEHISQRFGDLGTNGEKNDPAAASALRRRASPPRRQVLRAIALIGGTSLITWGGSRTETWQHAWQNMQADYSTAKGEIREIALADGSTLWLDTDSAVSVEYSNNLRRISLLRGDISITTAHASTNGQRDSRAFVVDGKHGRMRALGTRFSVRQRQDDTLLSVFEGAVEITPAVIGTPARVIPAGQQVRFTASAIGDNQPADLARQTWTQGLLVAADMPLHEFVAELSRYRTGYLVCDDRVANLRLVGVYSLRDTDQALAALAAALPVRIQRRTRWWVTVQAA